MGLVADNLGLDCADCHPGAGSDKVNWEIATPQKKTARKMIDMVGAINKANFGGAQMVTCWTCHHGREIPGPSITLDKLYSAPNDEKDDIVAPGAGEPTLYVKTLTSPAVNSDDPLTVLAPVTVTVYARAVAPAVFALSFTALKYCLALRNDCSARLHCP